MVVAVRGVVVVAASVLTRTFVTIHNNVCEQGAFVGIRYVAHVTLRNIQMIFKRHCARPPQNDFITAARSKGADFGVLRSQISVQPGQRVTIYSTREPYTKVWWVVHALQVWAHTRGRPY